MGTGPEPLPPAAGPLQVLPAEVLHGFTFALAWGGGCAYCAQLAPPGLEATSQGLFQGQRSRCMHPAAGLQAAGASARARAPRVRLPPLPHPAAGIYFGVGVAAGELLPACACLLPACCCMLSAARAACSRSQHSPTHPHALPCVLPAGSFVGGLVFHRHGAQAVYIVACSVLAAGWLLTSLAQLALALAGRRGSTADKYLRVAALELADVEQNKA